MRSALLVLLATSGLLAFAFIRLRDAGPVAAVFAAGEAGPAAARGAAVPVLEEEIAFTSRGTPLRGTLHLPPGRGPHPLIVTVHGSGRIDRSDMFLREIADRFAPRGLAVFSFDKRGTGTSGGEYPGSTGGAMLIYAADVLAAVDHLRVRPDIDSLRVGLWGISQAGWIIPAATSMSLGRVAFTIIVSGPTVSIVEENAYSDLTGDTHGRATGLAPDEVARRLARVEPGGLDAYPLIEEMAVPGLWLYGELDQSVPWREALTDLERIRVQWKRDFTVHTFARANHAMKVARTGGSWERPVPAQIVPGYFEVMETWLRQTVGLSLGDGR